MEILNSDGFIEKIYIYILCVYIYTYINLLDEAIRIHNFHFGSLDNTNAKNRHLISESSVTFMKSLGVP